MQNDNLFIFTGGPGSGKTTLLNSLIEKGFTVAPETAREIIRERLKNDLSPRPEPIDFAIQIFKVDLDNYKAHANAISTVFFDRSLVDSAYMISAADASLYQSHAKHLMDKRFNPIVFAFPPWEEIYQNDSERDQSFEEAKKVFTVLADWYENHHYRLLEVPKTSPEKRAEFVLSHVLK